MGNRPLPNITRALRLEPPRKRQRCDETATLEPDDLEVIDQGRFRTPAQPLRNASSRQIKAPVSSPTISTTISADAEVIELDNEEPVDCRQHLMRGDPPEPVPATGLAAVPVPSPLEANMGARKNQAVEQRLARSSQAHAEERAQYRRMYMEPPPTTKTNNVTTSTQQSQPTVSSSSSTWNWDKTYGIATTSYIDSTNNGCVLCKKRWSNLQQARQHELESELHQSNLRIPELVRSANLKLFMIRSFPPSPAQRPEYLSDKMAETTDSQSSMGRNTSAPTLPTPDTTFPSLGTRDSSVIILDGPPHHLDKGKGRAEPSATPAPALVHVGRDLRRWSIRHARELPKDTYEMFQEIAASMMGGLPSRDREPTSSSWVPSTCEDPYDDDYIQ